MRCPKCGEKLVYDHIENKWYCLKCRFYPKPEDIRLWDFKNQEGGIKKNEKEA